MKLLAFGLILIFCCNVWSANIPSKFEKNMVIKFLEGLKTILKNGNDTLGIPVCDPFKSERLDINLNEDIIKVQAVLTKVNVNGLSEYNVNNDSDYSMKGFDDIVLTIDLTWLLVVADTDYDLKGKLDSFELYGNGDIKMSAKDFSLNAEAHLMLDGGLGGYLKMKELKLKLSLGSLDFKATGIYNDEELSEVLSGVISDMAPDLVKDEDILSKVIPLITKQLDAILSTKKALEWLKLIMG